MQHSSAGAATTAAVPAIAALPLLQLQTAQPGFPTASSGTAFLLHDVQSLQQTVLPLHLGGSSGSSGGAGTESEQMELDKRAIHRHPLFPLLASLFEKCEKATANVDGQVTNESFNADIEVFVRNQEAERKPFFSDDPEVDNLMVKAIQVLRIHLLELEKVNELCKDFCARYISCLRGKLSSGSLLKSDSSSDTEDSECHANGSALDATGGSSAAAAMCLGQGAQLVSGGTVFQMVQTSHGLVAQPLQIQAGPAILHGSTGAGVGGPAAAAAMQLAHFSLAGPGTAAAAVSGAHSPLIPGSLTAEQQTLALASLAAMDEDDDDDELNVGDNVVRSIGGTGGRGGKSKRGVLPKQATLIMKSWLFQHIVHPYPTEDEKRQIASQTNLTLLQVNNWFINARRRILQPMLDASNPDQSKSRKSKSHGGGGRPMQRFWPESMASLQSQHGGGGAGSSGASDSGAPSASASLLVAANSITVKPSDMQLFKCRMSASASTVGSSGGSALHPLGPGVLLYSGDHVEGIGLHELSGDSQRQPPLSRSVESGADDGGSSSSDAGLSE